jgi:predicted ATP-binding protein involved in virulence
MRIDRLLIKNFKGFQDREFSFHREFNLVVGVNGMGKTSLLDALSVSMGAWFLGFRGGVTRHIGAQEVLLRHFEGESKNARSRRRLRGNWEAQYPCSVEAVGEVIGAHLSWVRSLNTPSGRTTSGEAKSIRGVATQADTAVRKGGDVVLPLLSYYGTGRMWNAPVEQSQVRNEKALVGKERFSRLSAYRHSIDPNLSVAQLIKWIAHEDWAAYQQRAAPSPTYTLVRKAIVGCVENARDLYFDAGRGELILEMEGQCRQPFNNLSDGQRCMLAMVGDIAQKAVTLNPHLGSRVLEQTSGVVLIDELDLHLHPRWQRRVIEDLRRTFPQIQFFATTHSPFLIQSLRSGEELTMLSGEPAAQLANMTLDEIAQGIMGISNPQVSLRYEAMKDTAHKYLETLEEAKRQPREKLQDFKDRLAESVAPYADNPAFQAFLEMKRIAKLGD